MPMMLGQPQDARARARSEAAERLARTLAELREAEAILASIRSIVAVREEAHRVASSWMDAMAEEARRALATRTLDRLMTPSWLRKLENVASRHDSSAARLEQAIAEEHLAIIAHSKIAARVRAIRQELQRIGPASPVSVITPPSPIRSYYPWVLSPFSSIATWPR